jgi:hypothetical protein
MGPGWKEERCVLLKHVDCSYIRGDEDEEIGSMYGVMTDAYILAKGPESRT